MKAWERERAFMLSQTPQKDADPDNEKIWQGSMGAMEEAQDAQVKMLWNSSVPGSYAREHVIVGGVQAIENRGFVVEGAEELIERGLKAAEEGDLLELHLTTAQLQAACNNPVKVEDHEYWRFRCYESYDQYRAAVTSPAAAVIDVDGADYLDRTHAGWLGQVVGGAFGTALEGYTTNAIYRTFGWVRDYTRKPNTYNDDITYELALLEAVERCDRDVSADDIGMMWTAMIPSGWSAEEIALQNLRRGIRPPESGSFNNPYREWIGAQMRGGVVGMLHPGDAEGAAAMAWKDGSVSHHNNGILGEVYNAVLVALSYVETDVRELLAKTMEMIPTDSEFYDVIFFVWQTCQQNKKWRNAWDNCERRLKTYNWIHCYPNVAAQIVAMWYGNGDFDETIHIIGMCGWDVDCNAAQALNAVAVMTGKTGIPQRWLDPIGDRLDTYVRGQKTLSILQLAKKTAKLAKKLRGT